MGHTCGFEAALRRLAPFVFSCFLSCGAVACVGTSTVAGPSEPGAPVVAFPDPAELEKLSAQSRKPAAFQPTVEVESWRVQTPTPEPGSAYPDETSWDRMLLDTVASGASENTAMRGPIEASPELRCAAQELSRFYAEHGGFANTSLQNYVALSCGSTLVNIGVSAAYVEAPEGVSDDTLQTQLVPTTEQLLGQIGGDLKLGMAYARGPEWAAVVTVTGRERAKLIDFSPIAQGVGVMLNGELAKDATQVFGLVNHGPTGVTICDPDPTRTPPQFRVFCPLGSEDKVTRLELLVRRPGQVLLDIVAQALVRTDESAELVYAPTVYGPSAHAATPAAFRDALYGSLNEARKAARVPPLQFEAAQAKWNERLAPAFLRAALTGDVKTGDRVAIGLLAGWDVKGPIRDGGIWGGTIGGTGNASQFLAHVLASPLGRWVLLEPSISRVAIGAAELPLGGVGAVLTTFSLFENVDHKKDEERLLAELASRRVAFGKGPPKVIDQSPELKAALDRIANNQISAHSSLSQALNTMSHRYGSLGGWSAETLSLEQFPFPDELMAPASLSIEFGITHYKPKGAAWNQYAVLFIIHPITA